MIKFLLLLLLIAVPQNGLSRQASKQAGQQGQAPPVFSISPASLDFGDQVVKKSSKPRRLTITNTGGKELYINSVVIEGDNQQDFEMKQDTCTGASIRSNRSCVVDVVFTPTTNEKRKAVLTFADNAIDSAQKVPLEGNGINSVAVPPRRPGRN